MKPALMMLLVQTASACLPVTGDRVLGSHLSLADPSLAVFPASMAVALAPVPGVKQVISATDIMRLAKSHGVTLDAIPSDVCFEFAMRRISPDEALEAMRRSLPSGATAEVIEVPTTDLPVGEIRFPLNTLEPGTETQTWRGFVQYTPTRRVAFSVRVRLQSGLRELILTRDVVPGTTFTPDLLTSQPTFGLSPRVQFATRPEQLLGTTAKVALKAGQRIPLSASEQPVAVRRGDIVSVEVRSGSARIHLDAIAQRAARDGEIMDFLNPLSGNTFKARLEGTRAVVTIGGRL